MRKCRKFVVFASVLASVSGGHGAAAAQLPPVKIAAGNAVPACATPGRLMAYLKARNPDLDRRFETIAIEYMRHGEMLGVRWDYAFYQMILETAALAYKRGSGKPGDVRAAQNNFAGLGATGGGERGESFPDVSTGVRAHLEHVLMYSGQRVESPVADRTRKVQEWGVLTSWHKEFKRPITFGDVGRKWAPGDRNYGASIESIADKFTSDHCQQPDPAPQMAELARKQITATASAAGGASGKVASAAASAAASPPPAPAPAATSAAAAPAAGERITGDDLVREAMDRARSEGDGARSSLGAASLAKAAPKATAEAPAKAAEAAVPAVTKAEPADKPSATKVSAGASAKREGAAKKSDRKSAVAPIPAPEAAADTAPEATVLASASATAAAGALAKAAPSAPAGASAAKCRVWTASYGGQKSVIIKSVSDGFTNYTVLDVNEGSEARETEAYVAAYAQDGQKVADFANQAQALENAFQLCPEG